VAGVAGVTRAALSNYEAGKRGLPLSTFLGLLAAPAIRVSELLDTSEVVAMRDTRLGHAVERLVANPELADSVL
jgi:transcriptional regulator with XRE-family HTH domain